MIVKSESIHPHKQRLLFRHFSILETFSKVCFFSDSKALSLETSRFGEFKIDKRESTREEESRARTRKGCQDMKYQFDRQRADNYLRETPNGASSRKKRTKIKTKGLPSPLCERRLGYIVTLFQGLNQNIRILLLQLNPNLP